VTTGTFGVLFFTRKQAAEVTNTSEDTIRAAINTGKLRAKRLGDSANAKYLISADALRDWFDQLEDA
jgi:excisionase family DNA binding protein